MNIVFVSLLAIVVLGGCAETQVGSPGARAAPPPSTEPTRLAIGPSGAVPTGAAPLSSCATP